MAGQSITFDFLTTGAEKTASGFKKVGDNTLLAARGAKVLADAIEKLGKKEDRTAAESATLAKALRQTGDAEDRVAARAVLADAAIRRLDDSMKDSAKDSAKARTEAEGLGKILSGLKINPGIAGPAVLLAPALASLGGVAAGAAIGLAGAFTAGGLALAGFGAIAKPVLSDAKTAAAAVEKAQNNYNAAIAGGTRQSVAYKAEQIAIAKAYAGMSPAQITLSRQVGAMASAWQDVKAAQTPVVAGALQPWLKSVTGLTAALGPIIAKIAPVIKDLGVQFGALVGSSAFKGFRDFAGSTGAASVGAGGSTIIDLIKSFMILLPKFNPLILKMTGGIAALGPAVLKWASSKKASDDITRFMQWFTRNGPAVGGFLKNIGGALKALAPGLTSGGALELKVLSGFLGLIAKLPPSVAKPLAEVAGAALILSKLGVLKVGLQFTGPALKWLTGGLVNIGGGAAAGTEIRAAMVSGGAAAAAEIRAAMAGGGAAAGAGGAAGAAAGGGGLAGVLAAARAAAGPATLGIVAGLIIKAIGDKISPKGSNAGSISHMLQTTPATNASPLMPSIFGGLEGKLLSMLAGGADTADKATARITADFAAQGKAARSATGDVGALAFAITHNGNASSQAHDARATLISDMTKAGVNAATAQADVMNYSNAVTANGASSTQAGAARRKLISDILATSANAQLGRDDLAAFTVAVQEHGSKSDAARSARQRLIADLRNSGADAKTAQALVDGLQRSIDGMHGKTVPVGVTGSGHGGVVITTSGLAAAGQGNIRFTGAARGLFIDRGTGPTADDVLIRASRGELIVPTSMVKAGAVDHLRGRIPGFSGGGIAGMESALGSMVGTSAGLEGRGAAAAMAAGVKAAMAKAKAAVTKAGISSPVGNIGSGVGRWAGLVRQALAMEGLNPAYILEVLYQMQTESGGNPNAINLTDTNAQHGDPSRGLMQTIMSTFLRWHWPGTSFNIYDPLANIAAALNYGAHNGRGFGTGPGQIGSGHGYAGGGVVPGFAAGGVAGQGAAYLKAWQGRHGGGFGAAWGPVVLNEQIARMSAAAGRARTLAGARGLTPGQHRFWAATAADETRRLGVLHRELTTERAWRGQLGAGDATLTREIAAAGNLPSLAGPARGWKAQLARQKRTIGAISGMLGYSSAYLAAHPPAPKLPGITHTYGGDIANSIAPVLSAALGPFTGAARGAMVSYDRGGWLKPGATMAWNGTGRPEQVLPARGGGGTLQIEWVGSNGGDDLVKWIKKNVRIRGGTGPGAVDRAFGAH